MSRFTLTPVTPSALDSFTTLACAAITSPRTNGNLGGKFVNPAWPPLDTPVAQTKQKQTFKFMLSALHPGSLVQVTDNEQDGKVAGIAIWRSYSQKPTELPPLKVGKFWKSDRDETFSQKVWAKQNEEFLRLFERLEPEGALVACDLLVVDPGYAKMGVGSLLADYGIEHAKKQNANCFANARPEMPLFERHGFELLEGQPKVFDLGEEFKDKPETGTVCMLHPRGKAH